METTMSSSERPFKKRSSWNKTRIFFTGLAIIGTIETAGAVITEQTNNIPVNAQTLITDFMWPKTLLENTLFKEKALPSFDKTATRFIIEAGVNTVSAANEDLRSVYEQQVNQNKDGHPTVIFPVIFTAPGQRINYEYQKRFLAGTDSQTGEPVYMERPGAINAHFDIGVEIAIPAENAEVFQFPSQIIDGKEYFVGLWIKFQQNGEMYAFGISAADVRTFVAIGEAINAPKVPVDKGGTLLLNEARDGLKLPFGTPVARVNINTDLNSGFGLSKLNPETRKWESVRPNFVTDGPDGQKKLLLPLTQK